MIEKEICKTIKIFLKEVEKNSDYMKSIPEYYNEELLPVGDNLESANLILNLFEKNVSHINDEMDLLNIQIVLGSIVEIILQLFLKIYYLDYYKSEEERIKKRWENFDEGAFNENFKFFLESESLTEKQRKKIKEILKSGLKEEIEHKNVDKVMFYDLQVFFEKAKIFSKEEIKFLDKIRKNRNFIHPILIREREEDLFAQKKEFKEILENLTSILIKLNFSEVPEEDY